MRADLEKRNIGTHECSPPMAMGSVALQRQVFEQVRYDLFELPSMLVGWCPSLVHVACYEAEQDHCFLITKARKQSTGREKQVTCGNRGTPSQDRVSSMQSMRRKQTCHVETVNVEYVDDRASTSIAGTTPNVVKVAFPEKHIARVIPQEKMRLSTVLLHCSAVLQCAAVKDAYLYIFNDERRSLSTTLTTISADTALSIVSRRHGSTDGLSLKNADEEVLSLISEHGGYQKHLFSESTTPEPAPILVRIYTDKPEGYLKTKTYPNFEIQKPTEDLRFLGSLTPLSIDHSFGFASLEGVHCSYAVSDKVRACPMGRAAFYSTDCHTGIVGGERSSLGSARKAHRRDPGSDKILLEQCGRP